jgi:integrase
MTLLEGLSRTIGRAPGKKVALLRDQLTTVIDGIELDTTAGLRDRALLLVGFALGLRRSELVALNAEDLSPSPDGVVVRITKSKTDQAGHGTELLLASLGAAGRSAGGTDRHSETLNMRCPGSGAEANKRYGADRAMISKNWSAAGASDCPNTSDPEP